jgi:hypothetical protein
MAKRVFVAVGLVVAGVLVICATLGQWDNLLGAYGYAQTHATTVNTALGLVGVVLFLVIAFSVNSTLYRIAIKIIGHQAPVPLPEPSEPVPPNVERQGSTWATFRAAGMTVVPAEQARTVTSADWLQLSEMFRRVPDPSVRADYTDSSVDGESWRICGGAQPVVREVESLCARAGAMLLKSNAVSASLHEDLAQDLRRVASHSDRWLFYLKYRYGLAVGGRTGVSKDGDGRAVERFHWASMAAISSHSATACIDASADEL